MQDAFKKLRAEIEDAEVKVLGSLDVLRAVQGELLDKEDIECYRKVREAVKILQSAVEV